MNNYIKKISKEPDFEEKGFFKGYHLTTGNQDVGIDYIEMESGHQFIQKELKSILIYYIIEGKGIATIDNNKYEIEQGDTVEIPVGKEFAFKGKMKMIEIMNPPFDVNTHINLRNNEI